MCRNDSLSKSEYQKRWLIIVLYQGGKHGPEQGGNAAPVRGGNIHPVRTPAGFAAVELSGLASNPVATVQLPGGALITLFHPEAFSYIQPFKRAIESIRR